MIATISKQVFCPMHVMRIHIIKGIDFLSYNKYTKVSVEVAI